MKNRYADLHLHVSLKMYVNELGNIWYHKPYNPNRDKPDRSEAQEYTQSDVQSLIKGNVNLSVVALYPLEDVVDLSLISKFIAKSFFGFKARKIKKLRKRFNTKYGLLLHEKQFIESGPLKKGNQAYMIVKKQSDLLLETTKLVLSIEGAHSLHGSKSDTSASFKPDVLRHLKDVKHWDLPVFMLTLCHFQYNQIAGQAWAIPLPGIAKPIIKKAIEVLKTPDDIKGITEIGREVIKEALDDTDGNRILIDLKHASVETRQEYYDYLRTNNLVGKVPVIVSHAGVSGIDTFQHQITKVDNQKANEAKHFEKFNPWGINICDDDIKAVMEIGGIIGISLDQRILGVSNKSFKKSIKRSLRQADLSQNLEDVHSCLFLENIFHIIKVAQDAGAWDMICLSSDNDGVIDPIDACPTAMHLSAFEDRLNYIAFRYYEHSDYKNKIFIQSATDLNNKIRRILYDNLSNFIYDHFPVKG